MSKKRTYTQKELFSKKKRTYFGDASETAFLLGGIGTGNISVGSAGQLRDFEIFNRPGKGDMPSYTFFAIHAKEEGKTPVTKVLEAQLTKPHSNPFGIPPERASGLPRFEKSEMSTNYPYVNVKLEDGDIPAEIELVAHTPFIPLNPQDSGLPCAIFKYTVKNTSAAPLQISVAASMSNQIGRFAQDFKRISDLSKNINEVVRGEDYTALYMYSPELSKDKLRYGTMMLSAMSKNVSVKQYWLEGGWWDGYREFWEDFAEDGSLKESAYSAQVKHPDFQINTIGFRTGSLCAEATIAPGEAEDFEFILTWHFPNRVRAWDFSPENVESFGTIKNRYATVFEDARHVFSYLLDNRARLERQTRAFCDAFYSGTLPGYLLEALESSITVLRSPTCIWLEDGTLIGWEGVGNTGGSCFGSCTHVWNYAQSLAFLFPTLEQSMRNVEFNLETDEKGAMAFRSNRVFGLPRHDFVQAADGQLGTIVRLCREWKLSGDMEFLKSQWAGAKRALEFAFTKWDSDGDFVLDSEQHNTYDIEFFGPNSMVNSIFFAALKAGALMAKALGDADAEKYELAAAKGSALLDEMLWNGEYYIQRIDDVDMYKYQYGTGCLSDQLLGQTLAHVAGLGYVLPKEHVKSAIKAVFEHNFRTDFKNHANLQRTFALNDEKGLLLCSWPNGGMPRQPFVYSDEVWTGIEYHVATHLIYEGFVEEGLTLVRAVRERYDGYRRNPWNEIECGSHYARSMAIWGVLTALSGYECDLPNKVIRFAPRVEGEFSAFWSSGTAWGTFSQEIGKEGKLSHRLEVLYGNLEDVRVEVYGREIKA